MPRVAAAVALDVVAREPFEDGADSAIRLAMVADVVGCEKYIDWATKRALCQYAMCNFHGHATRNDQPHMDRILEVWSMVETHTSRFHPEKLRNEESKASSTSAKQRSDASDFLVFRAAGAVANMVGSSESRDEIDTAQQGQPSSIDRVYLDTLNGYSTDLHELFSILKMKAKNLERDDPLLLALSRFQLFWLIACATRLSPEDMDGSPEQADARNTLELTTALLYHVKATEGLTSFVAELGEITESQIANAMNTLALHAKPNTPRADLGIVRLLRERGFTENGARRAAAMTNNESMEIALNWGVAHVSDPGFNDPIVLVKSPDDVYGDRNMMAALKALLVKVSGIAQGQEAIRLPKWERNPLPVMKESSKQGPEPRTVQRGPATGLAMNGTPDASRARTIELPSNGVTTTASGATVSTPKVAHASPAVSSSRSIAVEEARPESTSPPMIQARRMAAEAKRQAEAEAKNPASSSTKKTPPPPPPRRQQVRATPTPPPRGRPAPTPPPRVRPTPTPPPRAGDRSSLLQKGQQVRQQQRNVKQLNSEERKRFMSKARALVTRARSPRRSTRKSPEQAPRSAPLPMSKPPAKATPEKEDAASDGWDFDDFE